MLDVGTKPSNTMLQIIIVIVHASQELIGKLSQYNVVQIAIVQVGKGAVISYAVVK
jgi:hypothetical protein